jgi:D-tagatose-1,6-bisphosphate aldolase subunit GatZ/KbaZ
VYVIGTEVPLPGGAQAEHTEDTGQSDLRFQDQNMGESSAGLEVTSPEDARRTVEIFKTAFEQNGLEDAWRRVIALVVQPGVEFGHDEIHPYDRSQARGLSKMIESIPGMVFEAHSTDYQLHSSLKELVEDHFSILKVGPGLTFAFREAVFALARMEEEWLAVDSGVQVSRLIQTVDAVMQEKPGNWIKYYTGTPAEMSFARKYSFSDRIRYYWPDAQVNLALDQLLDNLSRNPPPLSLISQYLPNQYRHIRQGRIRNSPQEMIWDHIREVVQDYAAAC